MKLERTKRRCIPVDIMDIIPWVYTDAVPVDRAIGHSRTICRRTFSRIDISQKSNRKSKIRTKPSTFVIRAPAPVAPRTTR